MYIFPLKNIHHHRSDYRTAFVKERFKSAGHYKNNSMILFHWHVFRPYNKQELEITLF